MKCFVIYDETGRFYAAEYGDKPSLPTTLNFLQTDIERGSQITSVDISNLENPTLRYTPPEESALKKEIVELRTANERMNAQIEYLTMMAETEDPEVEVEA